MGERDSGRFDLQSASVRIEGDLARLVELLGMLDDFSLMFEVIELKGPV